MDEDPIVRDAVKEELDKISDESGSRFGLEIDIFVSSSSQKKLLLERWSIHHDPHEVGEAAE